MLILNLYSATIELELLSTINLNKSQGEVEALTNDKNKILLSGKYTTNKLENGKTKITINWHTATLGSMQDKISLLSVIADNEDIAVKETFNAKAKTIDFSVLIKSANIQKISRNEIATFGKAVNKTLKAIPIQQRKIVEQLAAIKKILVEQQIRIKKLERNSVKILEVTDFKKTIYSVPAEKSKYKVREVKQNTKLHFLKILKNDWILLIDGTYIKKDGVQEFKEDI